MEKLNGKTVLIGRDPTQGRLLVALQGTTKSVAVGNPTSVPNSVSRCKPAENTAHCKIDVDKSGNMFITNLKPANVTYVNGMQVESKKIDNSSVIALGSDKYLMDLNLVLTAAGKIAESVTPPPAPKTYSIKHLKKVWKDYEYAIEEIQRKQIERNRKRLLPIMIGSASAIVSPVLGVVFKETDSSWIAWIVPLIISAVSFTLYFTIFNEKDTSIEDRKEATKKLHENYVCPNPGCGKFLGNIDYELLKKQYSMQCPYCKCKFKE